MHSFHFGVQRFAKLLCMLTRKIQMVIIMAVYFSPTCIIICKSKFTLTFKKKEEKGHVQSLSKPISGCGTCCWKCHICTLWSAKPLGA